MNLKGSNHYSVKVVLVRWEKAPYVLTSLFILSTLKSPFYTTL